MTDNTKSIVVDGESVTIYPDKRKMLHRLNLRTVFILLPIVVLFFALFGWVRQTLQHLGAQLPAFLDIEFKAGPWVILVFYAGIYTAMLRTIQRTNKPIITISPEGLTIYTVMTQIGLLHWEDIAEIRTYNLLYRFVGIVPRNSSPFYKGGGSRTLLVRLNKWCVPLYGAFGKFVAPINIPQEYLPMTADELLARIEAARPDRQ